MSHCQTLIILNTPRTSPWLHMSSLTINSWLWRAFLRNSWLRLYDCHAYFVIKILYTPFKRSNEHKLFVRFQLRNLIIIDDEQNDICGFFLSFVLFLFLNMYESKRNTVVRVVCDTCNVMHLWINNSIILIDLFLKYIRYYHCLFYPCKIVAILNCVNVTIWFV